MRADSLLSVQQCEAAVALFEDEWSYRSVAKELSAPVYAIKRLYHRWRVRGSGALVTETTKRRYAFEVKREIVQRYLAGETKVDLAREFGLSSDKLVQAWAYKYRHDGEDGLRPKPRGRPCGAQPPVGGGEELEQLRRENERLRAEVAYLGKLRALKAQDRQR